MDQPRLVDERDITMESPGSQTYRAEIWTLPDSTGYWLAVGVYETRAASVTEVIEWGRLQAGLVRPARLVVTLVGESGEKKTTMQLHAEDVL